MNGCILFVAASLSLLDGTQGGRKSFELTPDGRWQQIHSAEPLPPKVVDTTKPRGMSEAMKEAEKDPDLARVIELLRQERYGQARDVGVDWLKANAGSPLFDRGLYLTAEALRGNREFVKAFYYCDQLLDEHGDSAIYQDALQLQYELADAYLVGAKDRLLGLRIIGRQDEAVEMLFRIQQRAPGSPTAEKALLRTADYYWASGDFDLAADAYGAYVKSYPRSPLVPEARLREAKANLAQFKGPTFDATPILNAQALMKSVQNDYPDLAKREGIDEKLELADRQLARKLYLNADFYRRTGKPQAAITVAKRLVSRYPNTTEAEDGRKLLARLGVTVDPRPVSEQP